MGNPILKDNNLNGLVLVGGKSTRMGRDKALLNYHGKPQIEYITELLALFCSEVVVSAKQQQLYSNFYVIEDQYDFESPLNGILSAFNYDANKAWLVVACDMPFIDNDGIAYLMAQRDKEQIATCYQNAEQQPEPLFSIYESTCFPLLTEFYKTGNYSPRFFLKNNDVQLVTPKNYNILRNVNSTDEFDRVNNEF